MADRYQMGIHTVIVYSDCYNKIPETGKFIMNRKVSSHSSGSTKLRYWHLIRNLLLNHNIVEGRRTKNGKWAQFTFL
jgi:hypothetical protein